MGNIENKANVIKMHKSIAETEAKLSDVKTEAWANTLAERLAEVKAETIGQTLTAVKGASLVKNWPPRLQR